MIDRFKPRLTYANVVASIALFIVLGGVAWAHGKIGTPDLKNGAVTTPKLKGNAVKAGKLGPGSVVTAKVADDVVTAPKLGPTTVRTNSVSNTVATKSVSVSCLAGEQVLGGGGGIPSPGSGHVLARSEPSGNGWSVTGHGTSSWTLQVYALCLRD